MPIYSVPPTIRIRHTNERVADEPGFDLHSMGPLLVTGCVGRVGRAIQFQLNVKSPNSDRISTIGISEIHKYKAGRKKLRNPSIFIYWNNFDSLHIPKKMSESEYSDRK